MLRSDGTVSNTTLQTVGQCLVIIVANCKKPSTRCLSVNVPMNATSGGAMLDLSLSPAAFLRAVDQRNVEAVDSFLVTHLHKKGISLEVQAARHQEIVSTGVLDVMLVVLEGLVRKNSSYTTYSLVIDSMHRWCP